MNYKRLKRLVTVLLIGVMLFGSLPGAIPAAAAGEFSVAFAEPYAAVGQPMTLDIQGAVGSISYSWTVDGRPVSSQASYTPTEDDLMKWIRVTVTCGSDVAELEMFFSLLPVVYINTEGGAPIVSKENYIDAELIIQGSEKYNSENSTLYNGVIEIRGRGNSTWNQPKKPYRMKLDKKTDVFGMGKSKHWVLLANYLDESLQRNTLSYNLSGAMGMEQMSTVYVDVILNGEFVGNYQFCENIRIDSTRVDIFDWESFAEDCAALIAEAEGMDEDTAGDLETYMLETNMGWITSGSFTFKGVRYNISDYPDIEVPDISGGYLLEMDEYYDEVSKFRTESGQPVMFKNPEFVNTNKDMIGYVQNYVQAFENAVQSDSYRVEYEGETLHYSELYDFDSLVDYWLINEIFFNEEINKKSTYMYKDIDGLMFMGPIWDMDWSSGGEGQTYQTEQWATRYYSTNAQANQWYKYLIQDPYFFIKAQERYWEIRNDQVADMMQELDDNYELLKVSANANGERWGYRSEYKKYVDDLRNWFNRHLTWLDQQMATQDSLRDSLGYYPSSRLALTLTDAEGNALAAGSSPIAPADAVAAKGASLKLNIQGGTDTDGIAALYVNGRRVSETATKANSTTIVEIPCDILTAPLGEKNVLEVQIEKPDGSINASRYITVIQVDADAACEHKQTAILPAVDATCTAPGKTEGKKCAICGEILIAQEEVPALGHTEVAKPSQEPTFDEPGKTGGTICSVCGTVLSEPELIPMLDYNEGIIPLDILKVSCGDYEQKGGSSEGPATLVLDDSFTTMWHTNWHGTSHDDHWIQFEINEDYAVDGLRYKPRVTGNFNGIITQYDILVSNDGVNFTSVASGKWEGNRDWKVATFDAQTVKFVRLQTLDAMSDSSFVFASAAEIRLTGSKAGQQPHEHSFGQWTVIVAPTCTEAGKQIRTCACGETESQEVAALGHNWEGTGCTRCDATRENPFEDVKAGEFYFDPVLWAVEKGITTGTAATTFGPNDSCNRAQVVTFLWRAAGSPEPISTNNPFTDVKETDFFYKAVLWAVEKGITTGVDKTHFDPSEGCNRAQVVTFLYRAAGEPAPTTTVNPFEDVKASDFFYEAVLWAVEKGITTGTTPITFGPSEGCIRAQVVTFLYRTYAKV